VGARHLYAATAAALTLLAVVVPLASAIGPMPGTENVKVALPPNGESIATRAPMPANSTTGTITVQTTSVDNTFFDHLTAFLTDKPTFGARAVSCILTYVGLKKYGGTGRYTYDVTEPTLQDLFLDVCIQLALTISQQTGGAPRMASSSAAARCTMTDLAVPVTITRTGSKYTAAVNGTSYTPKPKVRVSCTHTATGMTITERARSPKAKLSSAVGPILGIGFASSSASPGTLKIALGVR
jgi:hypothetical protein